MKRRRLSFVALLFSLLVPAAWAGASTSIGSQLVYPAGAVLTIDGFADDWGVGGLEPTLRVDPAFSLVSSGAIADAQEASADVYLLHDDQYLYIVAKVVDDNVSGYAADHSIWTNSGVEAWLSLSGKPDNPADYDKYEAGDYQINLVPKTLGMLAPQSWIYPDIHAHLNNDSPIEVAASLWTQGDVTGYIIEARILKAKLAGLEQIKAGATLRFAVSLVHIDKSGTWDHMWTPGVEYVELQVK